ncbi:MAG: helix-turn-helix transcriptional regulator [Candidatus Limiplasma sp.]|nr:helix-turn-helix transcriptional regulator [Candidatus Limiplasma sp.]
MEKIKELRLNKGWSQEELAKKSGVGRISIIRYENNERIPQVDVASRIANALGCTIDELLGETIDPDQPVRR